MRLDRLPDAATIRRNLAEAQRETRAEAAEDLDRAVQSAVDTAEGAALDLDTGDDAKDMADVVRFLEQAQAAVERIKVRGQ